MYFLLHKIIELVIVAINTYTILQINSVEWNFIFLILVILGTLGLEPNTNELKARCSTR